MDTEDTDQQPMLSRLIWYIESSMKTKAYQTNVTLKQYNNESPNKKSSSKDNVIYIYPKDGQFYVIYRLYGLMGIADGANRCHESRPFIKELEKAFGQSFRLHTFRQQYRANYSASSAAGIILKLLQFKLRDSPIPDNILVSHALMIKLRQKFRPDEPGEPIGQPILKAIGDEKICPDCRKRFKSFRGVMAHKNFNLCK